METCTVCGSWFVTGEPCEVCGNVVEVEKGPAPSLPSDPRTRAAVEDEPDPPIAEPDPVDSPPLVDIPDVGESNNNRTLLMVAAAAVALLVLIPVVAVGSGLLFGGDNDAGPETLAAVGADEATLLEIELDTFCANPRPLEAAPVPDPYGANLFATFEKLGALPWERGLTTGMYDEAYYAEEFPKLRVDAAIPIEPSYALCLNGVGDGRDRICADYGTGGQFEIFGATWTMSLYELASGEAILTDVAVRSELSVCPDIRPDLSRNQGPRAEHVRLLTVEQAMPQHYTAIHLEHDLADGSSQWCQSPTRVSKVGERAHRPGVFLLTNGSQALATAAAQIATSTKDVSLVTHVACLTFDLDPDERQTRCRFENQNLVKFEHGTYTVTVVEAATGYIVERETFDADVSCPDVFDFAHVRVHTLRGRLSDEAALWIDTLLTEPEEEEDDDEQDDEGKRDGSDNAPIDRDGQPDRDGGLEDPDE